MLVRKALELIFPGQRSANYIHQSLLTVQFTLYYSMKANYFIALTYVAPISVQMCWIDSHLKKFALSLMCTW